MKRLFISIIISFLCFNSVFAQSKDTLKHWGFSFILNPGREAALDKYQKMMQKGVGNFSLGAEAKYSFLPQDSNEYAHDYNYPELSFGVKYSFNHGITLHRTQNIAWGLAQEVDYDSRMGNTFAFYGSFSRALYRKKRWEITYSLNFGGAYTSHKYNTHNAIDLELIGSRWLIFFGAGAHVAYQFADNWGVKLGFDYWHVSNGALNRPNKGANIVGPSLAVLYRPYYNNVQNARNLFKPKAFEKYFYLEFEAGLGAKTLHEDWQITQFQTPKGEPQYRTDDFKRYVAWDVKASLMYRYGRRWASGLGIDLFYGSYSKHVADLDAQAGSTLTHSPYSLGVAAKHQVYFNNLSLAVSLGVYLYRHMGENAKLVEKPYYENIGIRYSFPSLSGLQVGLNVKAHLLKADYTEVILAFPVRISGRNNNK